MHEFGHFVAAKLSGMRVDEFGLGYPPRAMIVAKIDETLYTLNWLPFGGFVKIYGEDGLHAGQNQNTRAFSSKTRFKQAIVLVAGIAMNLLFAYALITSAIIIGTPRAISQDEIVNASDVELAVANVIPNSPAFLAGLLPGDSIISASGSAGQWISSASLGTSVPLPESFSAFIAESDGNTVTLDVKHEGRLTSLMATPATGVATADPSRYAIGVEVMTIGVVPLSLGAAIIEGASLTWNAIMITAIGLWNFFYSVFTLSADFSQIAGPVGIAGVVGDASIRGLGYLFSIMAIISINLALINIIPIPALDGGRLLFVIIESIIRRPIKTSIVHAVNSVGFVLLILLMLVVTASDIFKIVR